MTNDVRWSRRAREDVVEIYLAIAADQPRVAERYLDAIEARIGQLAAHPRLGVRRPDIRPNARMLVQKPYLILYRTEPDTDEGSIAFVEIVRVVHGRQSLSAMAE